MQAMRPATFLDRDGVINIDHGYISTADRFEFVENAPEAIRHLNEQGRYVLVVTNQSGIARGMYTEEQFLEFTSWIDEELKARGARVDKWYYCPHHPSGTIHAFTCECECRKPNPGMLKQALTEFDIDLSNSYIIGDKNSDLAAGAAIGVSGYLFEGGDLLAFIKEIESKEPLPTA